MNSELRGKGVKMRAYQTGYITKEEFLKEIKWHRDQDSFVQGKWFEDGKGCAVGCSLESLNRKLNLGLTEFSNFEEYEKYLGIPEWVARLEEKIFEGLSKEDAKDWVYDFSSTIKEGQDLNKLEVPFKIYIQEENLKIVKSLENIDHDVKEEVINVIDLVINSLKNNLDLSAAKSAAESAVYSAAESAVYSVRAAAESAVYSAAESAAYSVAYSAESVVYKKYADKFLEMVRVLDVEIE